MLARPGMAISASTSRSQVAHKHVPHPIQKYPQCLNLEPHSNTKRNIQNRSAGCLVHTPSRSRSRWRPNQKPVDLQEKRARSPTRAQQTLRACNPGQGSFLYEGTWGAVLDELVVRGCAIMRPIASAHVESEAAKPDAPSSREESLKLDTKTGWNGEYPLWAAASDCEEKDNGNVQGADNSDDDHEDRRPWKVRHRAATSMNIFQSSIRVDPSSGALVADDLISAECFAAWVKVHQRKHKARTKMTLEKAFQRALTSHITGCDGRRHFSKDQEAAILLVLRRKRPW